MALIRADVLVTKRKLAESRSEAADLLRRGLIAIAGKPVVKPGAMVLADAAVVLLKPGPRFVSRGGDKLAGALDAFGICPAGRIALDCGASTGGFTDCLLQRGALKVYAVDVGYGQLHWKLRTDPRVSVLERTNIRYLSSDLIDPPAELATLDLSFISLKLIMGRMMDFLMRDGAVVALIKPQFEAGRDQVGSGGVVRDASVHKRVLMELAESFQHDGWVIPGVICSSLTGPKGNREFFFHMKRNPGESVSGIAAMIDAAVNGKEG
ncbi:TlyA family RNA methyltransferase [bacterium]|nr:TlyA family RNA methyltransferase [candidate division CSSED10-310 bacterium]